MKKEVPSTQFVRKAADKLMSSDKQSKKPAQSPQKSTPLDSNLADSSPCDKDIGGEMKTLKIKSKSIESNQIHRQEHPSL